MNREESVLYLTGSLIPRQWVKHKTFGCNTRTALFSLKGAGPGSDFVETTAVLLAWVAVAPENLEFLPTTKMSRMKRSLGDGTKLPHPWARVGHRFDTQDEETAEKGVAEEDRPKLGGVVAVAAVLCQLVVALVRGLDFGHRWVKAIEG